MPWISRGIREGIVTTHYPRRPDDFGPTFRATVSVRRGHDAANLGDGELGGLCPTRAISTDGGDVRVDRGRCITCGRCVAARPDVFRFDPDIETAVLRRDLLVVPEREDCLVELAELRSDLARRVRALRRSIHIRHVDCGSDGAEEWEIAALTNPIYDIQRLGMYFTASPRHADVLLVTGAGAAGMLEPLQRTFDAMPAPRVIVAVGTDAASGGMFAETYATRGGLANQTAVDVFVPGSPPSPFSILHGILLAIGLLPVRVRVAAATEADDARS
jgi:Ni,Fe-hydrogenase III small subunit/ferredoxin